MTGTAPDRAFRFSRSLFSKATDRRPSKTSTADPSSPSTLTENQILVSVIVEITRCQEIRRCRRVEKRGTLRERGARVRTIPDE